MRRQLNRKKLMAEINVVPYIDVMLVLLIIFMITTPLLTEGVKIDLPHAKARKLETKEQQPIIISVDKKGQYYLNVAEHPDKPLTSRALVNLVAGQLAFSKEAGVKRQVMIRGDKKVDYGHVVVAMALLQKAGVEDVGLMTNPAEEEGQA